MSNSIGEAQVEAARVGGSTLFMTTRLMGSLGIPLLSVVLFGWRTVPLLLAWLTIDVLLLWFFTPIRLVITEPALSKDGSPSARRSLGSRIVRAYGFTVFVAMVGGLLPIIMLMLAARPWSLWATGWIVNVLELHEAWALVLWPFALALGMPDLAEGMLFGIGLAVLIEVVSTIRLATAKSGCAMAEDRVFDNLLANTTPLFIIIGIVLVSASALEEGVSLHFGLEGESAMFWFVLLLMFYRSVIELVQQVKAHKAELERVRWERQQRSISSQAEPAGDSQPAPPSEPKAWRSLVVAIGVTVLTLTVGLFFLVERGEEAEPYECRAETVELLRPMLESASAPQIVLADGVAEACEQIRALEDLRPGTPLLPHMPIQALESLNRLDLRTEPVTNSWLPRLSELPSLSQLQIGGNFELDLRLLEPPRSLERLFIRVSVVRGIEQVWAIPALDFLSLSNGILEPVGEEVSREHPDSLRQLTLFQMRGELDPFVARNAGLEKLAVRSSPVGPEAIANLWRLERLDLEDSAIEDLCTATANLHLLREGFVESECGRLHVQR